MNPVVQAWSFERVCFAISTALWAALTLQLLSAQEKPAHETRTWQALELPAEGWKYESTRIDVIDTEGVCLYVARRTGVQSLGFIAVPKTQLPKGTGCQ